MTSRTINIALCTDENFTIPALVCITSIFENNKDEDCHIFVLTDGISDYARGKFKKLAAEYCRCIDIKTIDNTCFYGLAVSERYPISIYYRFLLPQMLRELHHVLYLDCDIIVRQSLKSLFDINLDNYALGAVVAESCDLVKWSNDLKLTTPFFNSGVLLMNLDYWREHDSTRHLVKWLSESHCNMWLPDQYALNKVFEGEVIYLDYSYNFQREWTTALEKSGMHFSRWNDITTALQNPTIVHFTEAEKPWFKECKNPFQKEFLYYARLHDFIGFKFLKRYGWEYKCASITDRIGLKFRYYAERWKKHLIKKIRVS